MNLETEFVFEIRAAIDKALIVGDSSYGLRRIIPILGGTVEGPQLKAKIIPGGADWQYVRPDGAITLEAKYTLRTDDGVLIMVTNRGIRRGPKEVMDRLGRGEPVDAKDYYFRSIPEFEAPNASKYAWLNQSIFIGLAERKADAAIVQVFRLE